MTISPKIWSLYGSDVESFWKYFCKKYGTRVVVKAEAVEMQVVAEALATMGIMNATRFLKDFTTTLGRNIYTPFIPGNCVSTADCISQIAICVHEHVHVRQFKDPAYAAEYLGSSSKRALHEAEAYRASMEMLYLLSGRMPRADVLAAKLKNYACTSADVEVVRVYLRKAAIVVRGGGLVTPESIVAKKWLMNKGLVV